MDLRRLLHNPDDGGWFVIGETQSEAEMNDFRRSLKRNAIINTHLVNCTMNHDHHAQQNDDSELNHVEHKMKVQWTKCTSALCHPKTQGDDADADDDAEQHHYHNNSSSSSSSEPRVYSSRKSRACPVQLRMSTCQLTFAGIVCQAYQHLSDAHDSTEPLQSCVTEEMKVHVVRMLQQNSDVKPMVIYKELQSLHRLGAFGSDLMPTKIQLRNALTYLRSRKLKFSSTSSGAGGSSTSSPRPSTAIAVRRASGGGSSNNSSPSSSSSFGSLSRKRTFDSFSDGSASPPCDEQRLPE